MATVYTKDGDRYRDVASVDFADHGVWFHGFKNDDPAGFSTRMSLFVPWFNVAWIDYGPVEKS